MARGSLLYVALSTSESTLDPLFLVQAWPKNSKNMKEATLQVIITNLSPFKLTIYVRMPDSV